MWCTKKVFPMCNSQYPPRLLFYLDPEKQNWKPNTTAYTLTHFLSLLYMARTVYQRHERMHQYSFVVCGKTGTLQWILQKKHRFGKAFQDCIFGPHKLSPYSYEVHVPNTLILHHFPVASHFAYSTLFRKHPRSQYMRQAGSFPHHDA